MEVSLTRRSLLRGAAGAALALPFFDSLGFPFVRLAEAGTPKPPLRLLFVMIPNGANMKEWTPSPDGTGPLPATLAPLEPHRKELTILSGLTLDGARAKADGAGDHARAGASFLTCSHPRKTDGADIAAGVSIDQVVAKVLGAGTPFPSVELGTDPSAQNGNCDSGYSCAYVSNLSWASPSSPLAHEINPHRAFERLFMDGSGMTKEAKAKRDKFRASVLDAVKDDATKLRVRLGGTDRRKLDEYLESVRALEKRLAPANKDRPKSTNAVFTEPPRGIPGDYGDHLKRLHDVIKLAFETDTTRVITLMCGNEGSNRSYPSIGIGEGHHELSHHGKDAGKLAKIAKINRFHVEQLAYLITQLKSVKEGKGTLLDNTLVVFGSAISDGDAHNHEELPILLLGSAGGAIQTGRHLRYKRDTPLANLYLWILQRAGVKATSFGDSTEVLGF
jgi:hypothetical protein